MSTNKIGPKEKDQFNNVITYTFLSSSTRDAKETQKQEGILLGNLLKI